VKKVLFVRQVEKKPSVTLTKGSSTATPAINFLAFSKGDQIFLKGGLNPQPPANRPLGDHADPSNYRPVSISHINPMQNNGIDNKRQLAEIRGRNTRF